MPAQQTDTPRINFPDTAIDRLWPTLERVGQIPGVEITWAFPEDGRSLEVTLNNKTIVFSHPRSAEAYLDAYQDGFNDGFAEGRAMERKDI